MFFFFSSRRRHTRLQGDWSSDVCSSDLTQVPKACAHCRTTSGVRPSPTIPRMPDTPTMRAVGSVMAIGRASTASRFEGSDRKVERLDLGRSDGEGRFVGKGGEERLHDLGIELDAFPVLRSEEHTSELQSP